MARPRKNPPISIRTVPTPVAEEVPVVEAVTETAPHNEPVTEVVDVILESMVDIREYSGVHYVRVKQPVMGCKSFLIEKKGIYVLEEGEGVLRSLAVTYIGSGGFKVFDGLPSASGHDVGQTNIALDTRYRDVSGRRMFFMSPQIIGFWGLDAGFKNGLTIVADGGSASTPVLVTVVWDKHKGVATEEYAVEFGEE